MLNHYKISFSNDGAFGPCYLSSAMTPIVRTDATTARCDMKFVTRQNLDPKAQSLSYMSVRYGVEQNKVGSVS